MSFIVLFVWNVKILSSYLQAELRSKANINKIYIRDVKSL
jgi:hypothetical protein